jgi:Uma2 family endonuclease
VIEVASSSLRIDIGIKPPLYAEGGSPEYWVVDVAAKQVEVFTQPHGDRYAHRATHAPPAMLQPGSVPVPALALEALFAGL